MTNQKLAASASGSTEQNAAPYKTPAERIKHLEGLVAARDKTIAEWSELYPVTRSIYDLQVDVRALQAARRSNEEAPQLRLKLTWANFLSVAFVSVLAAGSFVAFNADDTDKIFEYLSYVLPLTAGWSAGLGVYAKTAIVPAFLLSIAMLMIGLCCYFQVNHQLADLLWVTAVVLMVASAAFWLLFPRAHPSDTDLEMWPIRWLAFELALLLVIVFFEVLQSHDPHWLRAIVPNWLTSLFATSG